MGKYQTQKEVLDFGEDVYLSIHNLQENKWANEWLNHSKSKEIKKDYLKLLFKTHNLCAEAVKTSSRTIFKKDFDALFDEFIEITKKLQMVEAEIKVKAFLDSLCKNS